jgi:hypothetical protein
MRRCYNKSGSGTTVGNLPSSRRGLAEQHPLPSVPPIGAMLARHRETKLGAATG